IIPNQNLFRVASEKTTFADAFALADQVLYSGVACISDLIVKEGLINLDFADVLSVMKEKGKAMMGRGEASGEKRVLAAAVAAISNPLIENPSIKRASGLIISITGGKDLMLYEVDEAATRIRDEADPDANIIVGASFDDSLEGIVRVSVVATGIDNLDPAQQMPVETSLTQLAGKLRNDSRRIADRIERSAPLPQLESPPLRPAARPQAGQPPRPNPEHARQAAPRPLDPYGRASPRNAIDDGILDIPAFLRRTAS
ncbi:cell division protein FtsZ, partial [Bradyrhizobium sp. UFLA05-153]